jgi:uncharacterized protein YbjT (DUF2867 family)
MRVVIAGGHGKIALRLARLLAQRGDTPVGLVRNSGHFDDLRAAGADPVLCDLEAASPDDVAEVVRGADAVVFAAGAGPGSGAGRKDTMDRAGPPRRAAGAVPRDDVAATLLALLDAPGSRGRTLELVSGGTPIAEAVAVHGQA